MCAHSGLPLNFRRRSSWQSWSDQRTGVPSWSNYHRRSTVGAKISTNVPLGSKYIPLSIKYWFGFTGSYSMILYPHRCLLCFEISPQNRTCSKFVLETDPPQFCTSNRRASLCSAPNSAICELHKTKAASWLTQLRFENGAADGKMSCEISLWYLRDIFYRSLRWT